MSLSADLDPEEREFPCHGDSGVSRVGSLDGPGLTSPVLVTLMFVAHVLVA